MDEPAALKHLITACVPSDPSGSALRSVWQKAKAQLGAATPNAGSPAITAIPAGNAQHVMTLMQTPWAAQALQSNLQGAKFQMVEIDPLLAFQFTVDLERSKHHCKSLSTPPTMEELMALCLPTAMIPETLQIAPLAQSIMIKARCLNLQTIAQGFFPQPNGPSVAGVFVGLALPLVHVVRWNGKCYLHNGFHRAVGAKLAGATQVPCIVRDVSDEAAAGIRADGSTFTSAELNSSDPPTLSHFVSGRACDVNLRAHSRIVHVSWAEYVAYDE